jgi:hypothetical protein
LEDKTWPEEKEGISGPGNVKTKSMGHQYKYYRLPQEMVFVGN